MNEERKMLIAAGMDGFLSESIQAYEEAYQELIMEGREENRKTKHRYARQDAATLLNRLEKYSRNHLLFLHDFNVYFEDERSRNVLQHPDNRRDDQTKRTIHYGEFETIIQRNTGYILAGVRVVTEPARNQSASLRAG